MIIMKLKKAYKKYWIDKLLFKLGFVPKRQIIHKIQVFNKSIRNDQKLINDLKNGGKNTLDFGENEKSLQFGVWYNEYARDYFKELIKI